jgi:hypothetical protein
MISRKRIDISASREQEFYCFTVSWIRHLECKYDKLHDNSYYSHFFYVPIQFFRLITMSCETNELYKAIDHYMHVCLAHKMGQMNNLWPCSMSEKKLWSIFSTLAQIQKSNSHNCNLFSLSLHPPNGDPILWISSQHSSLGYMSDEGNGDRIGVTKLGERESRD